LGALTILPPEQVPPRPTIAIPIGRIGQRFYLPTHANLSCAADPEELESQLADEVALVIFLPQQDALAVTDNSFRRDLLAAYAEQRLECRPVQLNDRHAVFLICSVP
jgi:hypothetical protein